MRFGAKCARCLERRRPLRLPLAVVVSVLALPSATRAGHLTVAAIADENLTPGAGCSLREAIIAANANADHGGCTLDSGSYGADVIDVPAMNYVFTVGASGENAAAGGDLDINGDLTIRGAGISQTFIDADGLDRVFEVRSGTVTLSRLRVTGGSFDSGGGIRNAGNLRLADVLVENNTSGSFGGGGIYNGNVLHIVDSQLIGNTGAAGGAIRNDGTLTVMRSRLILNTGNPNAGGINNNGTAVIVESALAGNSVTAGAGGALRNGGTLTLVRSTLSSNSSQSRGGGIYNRSTGILRVTNSTLSGNSDTVMGGGIHNEGGTVTLANVTVTGSSPDGIYNWQGGSVTVRNSIVALQSGGGPDCAGATVVTSGGHNVVSDASCGFASAGDQPNTDPLLGPLTTNGGVTFTHALLAGSPAVDAGAPAGCQGDLDGDGLADPLVTDQRGRLRVDGDGDASVVCDVGAYEFAATTTDLIFADGFS